MEGLEPITCVWIRQLDTVPDIRQKCIRCSTCGSDSAGQQYDEHEHVHADDDDSLPGQSVVTHKYCCCASSSIPHLVYGKRRTGFVIG